MALKKGDKVTATCDIGGTVRDFVPAGTNGIITETGLFDATKVLFTLSGFLADAQIELWVNNTEIESDKSPDGRI